VFEKSYFSYETEETNKIAKSLAASQYQQTTTLKFATDL
jgi:hypothetical protein